MTRRLREAIPYYRSDEAAEPRFLSVEEVLELHHSLIGRFGGDPGVISAPALESAVAQPRMTAFGQLIHPTRIDQAGAYLFHLVAGHPFSDGNKRIGLLAGLVFLRDHACVISGTSDDWYELTMAVARSEVTKREVTKRRLSFIS